MLFLPKEARCGCRQAAGEGCQENTPSWTRQIQARPECSCICRYKLPVVIIVLNNGGIYGGDRRPSALQQAAASGAADAGFAADPVPTAFVPDARCSYADALVYPALKVYILHL